MEIDNVSNRKWESTTDGAGVSIQSSPQFGGADYLLYEASRGVFHIYLRFQDSTITSLAQSIMGMVLVNLICDAIDARIKQIQKEREEANNDKG